ncbi:uncharacterized protein [Dendropsophus ebraccatus]|uniref:uncharacterized protein isoform X1 n=1 Tax=Dendropsophus ebraccatus TaxID=150705 RepID=UPI0038314738
MRFIFLLLFLHLIHNTQCDITLFKDFSSWTILSYESPIEKPPPPTMFEDVSSWIKNILSYGRPIEKPPPPPPTMVEEFLYWINNVLSVPVPPAHRRTRERCIENNPSKSTGPREKPTIIKMMYKWISAKAFGEPPPPVVPPGCIVTLRDRVISGVVYGLLISPIFAVVVLAAWLAQPLPLPDIPATVPEPARAADEPVPEPSRPKKSALKVPSSMGARKRRNKAPKHSSKRVSFNKMVHFRPIPPNHCYRRAPTSEEHHEREFVEDPMSAYDLALDEDTDTDTE